MIFLQMLQKLYCSFKATIIHIQNMEQPWYNACKKCNKKIFMRDEIVNVQNIAMQQQTIIQ